MANQNFKQAYNEQTGVNDKVREEKEKTLKVNLNSKITLLSLMKSLKKLLALLHVKSMVF